MSGALTAAAIGTLVLAVRCVWSSLPSARLRVLGGAPLARWGPGPGPGCGLGCGPGPQVGADGGDLAGPGAAAGVNALGTGVGLGVEVDVVTLIELVDVALGAGASVPAALRAVGEAVGGRVGSALADASAELLLGASWAVAWERTPERLGPLAEALAAAWVHGSAPGPELRARAAAIRRERRRGARSAAGRLGVHLVLPLGLCFLPAFVLLGLVPVLVSLTRGLVG